MRIHSLLLGQRPTVPAWAALYSLLFAAGLATYVAVVPEAVLPSAPLGLLSIGGQLVVRALLLGELTRVLLVISRDRDISRLTKFCIVWAITAMSLVAYTLQLHPGPYNLVASAAEAGCWYLAHRFISAQLYFIADLDAWRRKLAAVGERPRPEWLQQLATELESDPSYRDQH